MKNLLSLWMLLASTPVFSQANQALVLNGTSEKVSIGTPLATGSSYTKEAWINPSSSAGAHNIISSQNAPFWIANNKLLAGHAGQFQVVNDDQDILLNTWTHVAVTYDAVAGVMRLYKNGILLKTASYAIPYASEPSYIGSHMGGESYFNGKLDEVRIWNRCLSQQEIKRNMFKSPASNASGLLQYFTCNQSATGQLNNSVSGGTHGTATGGSFVASPIQFGNNSMHFDGVNDVVVVPASPTFNLSVTTVELMVRPTASINVNAGLVGFRQGGQTRFSVHVNTSTNQIGMWNGTAYAIVPFNFVIGQWYHIAYVIGVATTAIYVNGVHQGNLSNGMGTATNLTLNIGSAEVAEYFTGQIDEIRIWNHLRSVGQIQQFMSREIDPSNAADATGLVAYYTFNQGVADGNNQALTTLVDQVGASNGVVNNMGLNGTTSNFVSQHALLSALALIPNSFAVQHAGEDVLLKWKTTHKNVNSFHIERSNDGRTWHTIGTVNPLPAGQMHSFLDLQPLTGKNYYRLAEFDTDGKILFSEIRSILVNQSSKPFELVSVQQGALHLRVLIPGTFRLFAVNGRLIGSKYMEKGSGLLTTGNITPGIYLLQSADHTEKVLIR